ncbi:sulfide/dihydroorotate dehydrogenase-like FAD/NAD-binding protein [Desulfuribacillus alkaliarsenatis]|uniref:Ferredoxin-NADP reductase n=1 Tax=Desulfuribacillus alkaliarsenatis TaxID=766136 RepID=A0A1E5G6S2_9FIRM|nr:sulfide/dihydroorotate dehydrogenase-like FAD/NAD-binding protein [Desulfuribacillus alkaliarsenatis]OEF98444.1 ferredoxin-NADP reductase [Desulfuribacillus alkaliarsenatis]
MYKVLRKKVLTDTGVDRVILLDIEAPLVAKKHKPGHFVMLRIDEKGERVPLTIADANPETGAVTIIAQEVGSTSKQLGRLEAGDHILDFVGPLGQAAHYPEHKHVVCIGGGLGVAPLYPEVKHLYQTGSHVTSIVGARNKDLILLESEMQEYSHEFYIATDDGSYGTKGFVTTILQELIDSNTPVDLVIAIGPIPMMKAVANLTRKYEIKTLVSLNSLMVDGTGMCGACRVTVGGETKFTCIDGPEFDGHLVDFDEQMRRLSMYKDKEKEVLIQEGCGGANGCQ